MIRMSQRRGIPPQIVQFGYRDWTTIKENNKVKTSAVCNICGAKISGVNTTTSNYITHIIRTHKRKEEYEAWKNEKATSTEGDKTLVEYHPPIAIKHEINSPGQSGLVENIALNLCVDCDVSIDIVEKEGFRRFIQDIDPRYNNITRKDITQKITEESLNFKRLIQEELKSVETLSLIIDIWEGLGTTNGKIVAATANYVFDSESFAELISMNLAVERFQGDSAEEIIQTILSVYEIRDKAPYFIINKSSSVQEDADVEFPNKKLYSLFGNLNGASSSDQAICGVNEMARLDSFAHSLKHVIRDGMQEATTLNTALDKVQSFLELLSNSTILQKAFEEKFGQIEDIPDANIPGWLNTFRQVEFIVSKESDWIDELTAKSTEQSLTRDEWQKLEELVQLMAIFAEATVNAQSQKPVSISLVIPTVLSLYNHTQCVWRGTTKPHLTQMTRALRDSILKHFQGVLVKSQIINSPSTQLPFSNDVYLVATVLDPNYQLLWVNIELSSLSSEKREIVKISTTELICSMAKKLSNIEEKPELLPEPSSASPPPSKVRLLGGYRERLKVKVSNATGSSFQLRTIGQQLQDYLNIYIQEDEDPYTFWRQNSGNMPELAKLALTVLSVPATNSPMEHIVSDSGIKLDATTNGDVLTNSLFLKCNRLCGRFAAQPPTLQLNFI